MKKITLILCCLALVILGTAQPTTGIIPEKYVEKIKREKLVLPQKQTSLSKMKTPTKSPKDDNWWEPDTIYVYGIYGFITDKRHTFLYEDGKCIIHLVQEWENNQWGNLEKYSYKYDSQNNMIEKIEQSWQWGEWINNLKSTYIYNSQNNITSYVISWHLGQWMEFFKGTLSYDSQNNLTEMILQIYSGSDIWENLSIERYTYNAQNVLSEILSQQWEDAGWEDITLQTFYYNEQNQCTYYILQYYWEDYGWENEKKVVFTYDAQNNITSKTQSWWGWDEWINTGRFTCSYDENNNAISGFCQYWSSYDWVNDEGYLYVYYNNMQSLDFEMFGHRFTATYIKPSSVGVKENNLPNNSVLLYPNPVSNILHIETSSAITPEIKIYSIQGVLLINAKGNQIDVSSLPSGIYITEVNGVCQKIVKQ